MTRQLLSCHIESFLKEKRLSGYSYRVQERWMKQFGTFCEENSTTLEGVTLELMESFWRRNPGESIATQQRRQCLMKQFASFLNKNGIETPMPESPEKQFSYSKRIPYIFSKEELAAIFHQIDHQEVSPYSRGNSAIIDPLIFRMAYGCGMRIMEVLKLGYSDVDPEGKTIHIRHGKNGRERRIPVVESLARKCLEYIRHMHRESSDKDYFFPGMRKGTHASYEAACRRFKEYLWSAGIVRTDKGPTIHDLRHSFCVHRMRDWTMEGADLSNLLPYLSAFLGHADFRGTEYYLRLTADLYPEFVRRQEVLYESIIPGGETNGNS